MNRIVTPHELRARTKGELSALFRQLSQELASTKPGSYERRNALASLENIQRAQVQRRSVPKPPGS